MPRLDRRRTRKLLSTALGTVVPANALVLFRNVRDGSRESPWAGYLAATGIGHRDLIERSLEWLCHSQDRVGSGGVGCYEFGGWTAGYPEVTGYVIPTVWDCSQLLRREDLAERAVRMADWELRVQKPGGGFESFYEGDGQPPVVFNTGQVLRDLLRTYRETGRTAYLEAARRSADWITSNQERDGSWGVTNYGGLTRVYDTYVAAPLADLGIETGTDDYIRCAERNYEFALGHQHSNGWFDLCDNTAGGNDAPVTHTLCYTIDGLLEGAALLGRPDLAAAAGKAADRLASLVDPSGRLPARFDSSWAPTTSYVCVTGSAQLGVILMKLYSDTGERRYRDVSARLIDFLAYVQQLNGVGRARTGGLPGSYPIWGRYVPLKYPSWPTKYFLDLLVLASRSDRQPGASG